MIQLSQLECKPNPTDEDRERVRSLQRQIRRRVNRDVALVQFLREASRKLRDDIGPHTKLLVLEEVRRVRSRHLDHSTDDEGDDIVDYTL